MECGQVRSPLHLSTSLHSVSIAVRAAHTSSSIGLFSQKKQFLSPSGKPDGRAYFLSPPSRIVVCSDRLQHPGELETVLIHELQHAIDNDRLGLDLSDAQHLACSEVRAAKFAECRFMEDTVFFLPIGSRRRSSRAQAVKATRTAVGDRAAPAVDAVFDRCYASEFHANPLVGGPGSTGGGAARAGSPLAQGANSGRSCLQAPVLHAGMAPPECKSTSAPPGERTVSLHRGAASRDLSAERMEGRCSADVTGRM